MEISIPFSKQMKMLQMVLVTKCKQNGYNIQCHALCIPEFLIYDDACHLKKYATNSQRSDVTPTAQRIATLNTVVDRFHFPGHVDPWCRKNCNPDDFDALKNVRQSQ